MWSGGTPVITDTYKEADQGPRQPMSWSRSIEVPASTPVSRRRGERHPVDGCEAGLAGLVQITIFQDTRSQWLPRSAVRFSLTRTNKATCRWACMLANAHSAAPSISSSLFPGAASWGLMR